MPITIVQVSHNVKQIPNKMTVTISSFQINFRFRKKISGPFKAILVSIKDH